MSTSILQASPAVSPLSREEYERLSLLGRDQRSVEEDQQILHYYLELFQRRPLPVPLFPTPPVGYLVRRAGAILDEDFRRWLNELCYAGPGTPLSGEREPSQEPR